MSRDTSKNDHPAITLFASTLHSAGKTNPKLIFCFLIEQNVRKIDNNDALFCFCIILESSSSYDYDIYIKQLFKSIIGAD